MADQPNQRTFAVVCRPKQGRLRAACSASWPRTTRWPTGVPTSSSSTPAASSSPLARSRSASSARCSRSKRRQGQRRRRRRPSRRSARTAAARRGSRRRLDRRRSWPEEIEAVVDRAVAGAEQRPSPGLAPVKAQPGHPGSASRAAALRRSRPEGCDHLHLRHPWRCAASTTKPIEQILAEAKELASDGVRELNPRRPGHLRALTSTARSVCPRELDKVDGIDWIRVLYAYPIFTDDVIAATWSRRRRSCRIPICRSSTSAIASSRMQGKVRRADIDDLLGRLRAMPSWSVDDASIAGFPGETDEEFEELVQFVQKKFGRGRRLHLFAGAGDAGRQA